MKRANNDTATSTNNVNVNFSSNNMVVKSIVRCDVSKVETESVISYIENGFIWSENIDIFFNNNHNNNDSSIAIDITNIGIYFNNGISSNIAPVTGLIETTNYFQWSFVNLV